MRQIGRRVRLGFQVETVQLIEGRPVDRNRHELAPNRAQHSVFIGPPRGEAGEIGEHARGIGVENMRAVAVHAHAVRIEFVVGVAADVETAVDQKDALLELARQPLRHDRSGEAGANDQVVEPRSAAAR